MKSIIFLILALGIFAGLSWFHIIPIDIFGRPSKNVSASQALVDAAPKYQGTLDYIDIAPITLFYVDDDHNSPGQDNRFFTVNIRLLVDIENYDKALLYKTYYYNTLITGLNREIQAMLSFRSEINLRRLKAAANGLLQNNRHGNLVQDVLFIAFYEN